MMRAVMRVAMVVRMAAVTAAVIAGCAGDLAAGQGLEANYSLRGTVVNSVTGEPIHNALVTLSTDGVRSVFTATDGSFEFRDLKETGDREIFVMRPGYFSPQLVRFSRYSAGSSTIPVRSDPISHRLYYDSSLKV
jgi:hypothetical protein